MSITDDHIGISEEHNEEVIEESFSEILGEYEVVNADVVPGETEPLCASCFSPIDADDEQDIGYCERCQTTVFVERREVS